MPIDEFTEAAYQGLASGRDQVIVGTVAVPAGEFHEIVDRRRKAFEKWAENLRGSR